MSKYLFSIILCILSLSVMAQEKKEYNTEKYRQRNAYFAQHSIGDNKVVFLGNSLTEGGKWDKYFPKQAPVNRGISGDNTEGMLNRIGEIIDAKPRILFILTGINDISQNLTNQQIIVNYTHILDSVQTESPKTVIYVQSILPINNDFGRYKRLIGKEEQVSAFNKALKKLCDEKKIKFINLYPHFEDKSGKLKKEITNDGLHLNDAGYTIWVKELKKYLK